MSKRREFGAFFGREGVWHVRRRHGDKRAKRAVAAKLARIGRENKPAPRRQLHHMRREDRDLIRKARRRMLRRSECATILGMHPKTWDHYWREREDLIRARHIIGKQNRWPLDAIERPPGSMSLDMTAGLPLD